MTFENLTFSLLAVGLCCSCIMSVYLWFVREQRSGIYLWTAYVIRVVSGIFIGGTGIYAWNLLHEDIVSSAVLQFVGPFAVVSLLCLVPWGLLLRLTRRAGHEAQRKVA